LDETSASVPISHPCLYFQPIARLELRAKMVKI
jgi:hypothetical protein